MTKECGKGGYGVDNVLYHVFKECPPVSIKRMNLAPAAMTGVKHSDIGDKTELRQSKKNEVSQRRMKTLIKE